MRRKTVGRFWAIFVFVALALLFLLPAEATLTHYPSDARLNYPGQSWSSTVSGLNTNQIRIRISIRQHYGVNAARWVGVWPFGHWEGGYNGVGQKWEIWWRPEGSLTWTWYNTYENINRYGQHINYAGQTHWVDENRSFEYTLAFSSPGKYEIKIVYLTEWDTDDWGPEIPWDDCYLDVNWWEETFAPTAHPLSPAEDDEDGGVVNAAVEYRWLYQDQDGQPQNAFKLQVTRDPNFGANNIEREYNGTLSVASGATATYRPQENLADGRWYWRIKVSDQGTNFWSNWSSPAVFIIDGLPPTPIPAADIQTVAEMRALNVRWPATTDAVSGVKEYKLEWKQRDASNWQSRIIPHSGESYSYPLGNLSPNTWYDLRLCTVDNVGNISAWTDFAAATLAEPTTFAAINVGGDLHSGYSATISLNSVAAAAYQIKRTSTATGIETESPWLTAPTYSDSGLTAHGAYTYQVRTRNVQGVPTVYSTPVAVVVPNNAPPAPRLLLPAQGSITNQKEVSLTVDPATDADGDLLLYKFEVTGTLVAGKPDFSQLVFTTDWQREVTTQTSSLADGTYYWRVRAKDQFTLADGSTGGEEAPLGEDAYATFQIDTVGLSGEFRIAAGEATATPHVTLVGISVPTPPSGAGPARLRFRNERTGLGPEEGWQEYSLETASIPWELPGGDGPKVISMQVLDTAGNWGPSFQQTILLDTTPPAIPTFKAAQGGPGSITVTWYPATDGTETTPGAGVAGYALEYTRRGEAGEWLPWVEATTALEATLTGLAANAEVHFRIKARDKVGNTSVWSAGVSGWSLAAASGIVQSLTGKDATGHYLDFAFLPVAAAAYRLEVVSDAGGATSSDWLTSPAPPGSETTGILYRDGGLTPHGTYQYVVVTRNGQGEETRGQVQTVTVANLPPPVPTLQSPSLGVWVAAESVELRHSAPTQDDDGDPLTYTYIVRDDLGQVICDGASSSLLTGLGDGRTYFWRVQVSDGWETRASAEGHFTVDLTPPTITLNDTDSNWAAAKTLSVTVTDATSGVAVLMSRWNNAPYQPLAPGESFPARPGTNILWVRAADAAGNFREISNLYRVDDAPPVVANLAVQGKPLIPLPGGPQARLGSSDPAGIFASWSITDSESGVAKYEYGVITEAETPATATLTTGTERTRDGNYRFLVPRALVDGQSYRVVVRAEDRVGRQSEFQVSEPIFHDASPPVVSPPEIKGAVSQGGTLYLADFASLQIQCAAEDPHSGMAAVEYALTPVAQLTGSEIWVATPGQLDFSGIAAGVPVYVAIRATNAVGLQTLVFTPALVRDATPPQILVLTDAGETTGNTDTLTATLTVTDPESGMAALRYALGTTPGGRELSATLPGNHEGWLVAVPPANGVPLELNISGLNLAAGTYFLTAEVTNGVGQAAIATTDGISVDPNLPALPLVVDDGRYSPDRHNCHAWWRLSKEPASPLVAYRYRLRTQNGAEVYPWQELAATAARQPVEVTLPGLELADGETYFWEVKACYRDGSESPVGVSNGITIDSTPPMGVSVSDGDYAPARRLTFTWQATEDISGLASARYAVGTTRGGTDLTGGFRPLGTQTTVTPDLPLEEGRLYYVTVAVQNGAGLETQVSSDGVLIDSTPPPPPKVRDQGLYTHDPTQLAANWTWTQADPESGTTSFAYALLSAREVDAATVWTEVGTATKVTVTDLALANGGVYYFAVRATNGAGLISIGFSDGIVVDTTAPDLPRIDDYGDYLTDPSVIRGLFSAVDPQSGIERYTYSLGTEEAPTAAIAPTTIDPTGGSVAVEHDNLPLTEGSVYYFTVTALNHAGLISNAGTSDGIMVDSGYPRITAVTDEGVFSRSPGELAAFWTAQPSASNTVEYQYAIVEDPNTTNIPWVSNGLKRYVLATGLALEDGKTYSFLVRARNAAGTWTPPDQVGRSDGIMVDASPPPTPRVQVESRYTAGTLYFAWDGVDPHSGMAGWEYAVGSMRGGTELTGGWCSAPPDVTHLLLTNLPVVHGGLYYVTVRGQNRAGAWSEYGYSAVIIGDLTPPTPPVVTTPGAYVQSRSKITGLSWRSQDPECGLSAWRYALTTNPGGSVAWSEAMPIQSEEWRGDLENLNLVEGATYYFVVQTCNSLGLWSETGSSQGITVDTIAPTVILPQGEKEIVTNAGVLDVPWELSEAASVILTLTRPDGTKSTQTHAASAGTQTAALELPIPGRYTLELAPVDPAGNMGEVKTQRLRRNSPPAVAPLFDLSLRKHQPVSLTTTATDSDGTIVSYHWDLGDGTMVDGPEVNAHRYTELGAYTVTLTVTDNNGGVTVLTFTVRVSNTESGTLYGDETWSGTHHLTGEVIVPVGVKLTILPGTHIQAETGVALRVQGQLLAQGEATDSISFVAAGTQPWRGLVLERSQAAAVSQAMITGAQAGIAVIETTATLQDVTFTGNEIGLHVYHAAPLVTGCNFFTNKYYGIKEDATATPQVKDCLFDANGVGAYYQTEKTVLSAEELNSLNGNQGNKSGRVR